MNRLRNPRWLMNAVDTSAGGGAAPAQPAQATPAAGQPEPQAGQPAASQPAMVPVDQLKSVVGEVFGELKNSLFADLRKAGALGKEKPAEQPQATAATPNGTAAQPAGLSAADVERMLERNTAITAVATKHELSPGQVGFMKAALQAANPDDAAAWTTNYVAVMGLAKVPAQAGTPAVTTTVQPATTNQAPPAAGKPAPGTQPNISDKGPPTGGDPRDAEAIYDARPTEATSDDFERLVAKHGRAKALEIVLAKTNAHLKTVKVQPDNRRQR